MLQRIFTFFPKPIHHVPIVERPFDGSEVVGRDKYDKVVVGTGFRTCLLHLIAHNRIFKAQNYSPANHSYNPKFGVSSHLSIKNPKFGEGDLTLFFVVFCVFITFVCCLKWIQYE